jgi:hypothetical protein
VAPAVPRNHIAPLTTLGVSYNGQFGDGAVDQAVRGVFTMQFQRGVNAAPCVVE